MQICTLNQTHNHASIPPLGFLQTGCHSWNFLPPNQQLQSTEDTTLKLSHYNAILTLDLVNTSSVMCCMLAAICCFFTLLSSLFLRMFACLSLHLHISKTTWPYFTEFCGIDLKQMLLIDKRPVSTHHRLHTGEVCYV